MFSTHLVIGIILVALIFDFINGFHDSANSIATVVSTRVLTPRYAVLWAAFFNFVAAFGFGVKVATTIGKGVIHPGHLLVFDDLVLRPADEFLACLDRRVCRSRRHEGGMGRHHPLRLYQDCL